MMTRDEMHADIGKAFQERKELSQKIKMPRESVENDRKCGNSSFR